MAYTPMMEQYWTVKNEYKDYILFYRLGDFYEMFFDDAQTASRVLELTLTGRDCGEGNRAPMCGVPYHACEGYIGKLISAGFKVAICEQTEDPALAKGLVKREVIRIVTPGTILEPGLLQDGRNNYLASVSSRDGYFGLCFTDVSTSRAVATGIGGVDAEDRIRNELEVYAPKEILLSGPGSELPFLKQYCADREIALSERQNEVFSEDDMLEAARRQFFSDGKKEPEEEAVTLAAGLAVLYIMQTQKSDVSHLKDLEIYQNSQYLEMDGTTRRNLELTETMISKEKKGSLLGVLDHTLTAMGARMLRDWIEHPLMSVAQITKRQEAVRELYEDFSLREDLKALFSRVLDLERLMTKVIYGSAGGRDLRAVAQTVSVLPEVRSLIRDARSETLREIYLGMDDLSDVFEMIDEALVEDPPFQIREGGMIREGFSDEVDRLREIRSGGKDFIRKLEEREKEKTGIKNLKVGYNHVFGYYIEVTRSQLSLVPDNYIRKQTLTGSERFITEELKDYESTVLGAEDKLCALEYTLFLELRDRVAACADRIRKSAFCLAELDTMLSLAVCAVTNNYVCPHVNAEDRISIRDGRHPVVERFVKDSYFVPNDAELDTGERRLLLITGPNMAGKSTYMRQTALIILMAQIGSFVPCSDATIGLVDRIFTRVGASDDLSSGQSTFMLEMREVAH
ncbi:MAG: DNA mismatch repair protein MutS, partial [Clostridia bacterium]|nr:DNA mismatch repair protein MutS [Clostridia bacterium]